ncbi:flavoprotein [Streptacidiphilus sp. MAP12-33]|uniref:flavoprotein n=1 Tax=Streptacidiphilus sp. MAP12-33 TaxID=3156266 RepID=UPI003516D70F
MSAPVLYLLGSAAPPVLDIASVVEQAQADGWDVCVGLTPTAADWLEDDLPGLEQRTGHPVRSRYRRPREADVWPAASVALVAPATFNTLNCWAQGITRAFIVGFAAEAIGKGIPLVTVPCVNQAFLAHPQFPQSIERLRGAGVRVLLGEGGFMPNAPGTGKPKDYPWLAALSAAREALPG